jgi:undecaprenyl-diphosphatase
LLIVLATLTFVGGSYAGNHHARDLERYAKFAPVRTLRFDAWKDGEWRSLPAARTEISGKSEEPFSVQWIATDTAITEALKAAGWQAPAAWKSRAALLWLLPSTPIDELPALPKFHQGQPPALTLIRPIDARTRTVIRLWRVAAVIDNETPLRPLPLWTGMITIERSRSEFGLIATTRTTSVADDPVQALTASLREERIAVGTRRSGRNVLLVW